MARTEALLGFIAMVAGAMDWSPLLGVDISTGFNRAQVFWLGSMSFVKGVFTELARRRRGSLDPV